MEGRVFAVAVALASAARIAAPPKEPASSRPATVEHECAACHSNEVSEWEGSLHHRSFTDSDFAASFAKEPASFCRNCHAPEGNEERGVGCRSCHDVTKEHGVGGAVSTRACGGCHEFTFPNRAALMQKTVAEHAASPSKSTSCSSCHRGHRFDVSRNVDLLRSSITMHASRSKEGLVIDLKTNDVGHAMPTGDLFRRLRVVVRAEDAEGTSLGEDEALLERRFDRTTGAPREIADTRVFGEKRVSFSGAWLQRAKHIFIELRYERVAQTDHAERGHRETLFASELLASDSL